MSLLRTLFSRFLVLRVQGIIELKRRHTSFNSQPRALALSIILQTSHQSHKSISKLRQACVEALGDCNIDFYGAIEDLVWLVYKMGRPNITKMKPGARDIQSSDDT